MLTLQMLWSLPLTLRVQKRYLLVNEVMAAWQYMEVFLIAVGVALLQVYKPRLTLPHNVTISHSYNLTSDRDS